MTLWRLEWLRITRTHRMIFLPAIFVVSAILGPVLARFLPDLIKEVGGIEVVLPEPTPYEGIVQYFQNVDQLGLLGVMIFSAMAIGFDSKREISVFLRSRASVLTILMPRIAVSYALAAFSVIVGGAVAVALTTALLGSLPIGDVVVGSALYIVYLGFGIAVVVLVTSLVRSVLVASVVSIGALIILNILTLIPQLGAWLPSALASATIDLMNAGDFTYGPSIATSIVVSGLMIAFAVGRLEAREI